MAVAAPAPLAATSTLADVEPRPVVKWGLIAGVTGAFVSIIGMVESFSDRLIIDPVLNLGYLALVWIPLVFGYQATYRKRLEGMPPPPRGVHNLAGGAAAGLLSGGVVSVLILLIDNVELRDIFRNVSPELMDLLTFDKGVGFGIFAMLAGGAALGLAGGALHLLAPEVRRAVSGGIAWTIIISLLELVVADLLEELPGTVEDWVYSPDNGLRWGAAIVVFIVASLVALAAGDRKRNLRAAFSALPAQQRNGLGFVLAFSLLALGFALPSILGSFLNEILTTVGLFLVMGLGLNIVVGLAGLLDLGYVAFFAVGAYTTAVLTSPGSPKLDPSLAWVLVIPIVILAAGVAGIAVGTPVIRMRGDYLAIVTLGFGEIARVLFLSDWLKPTFGGAQGILQIPSIRVWRWIISIGVVGVAVLVVWFSWRLWQRRAADTDLRWKPGFEGGTTRIATAIGGAGLVLAALTALGAAVVATKVGLSGTFVVQGTKPRLVFYAVFFFAAAAAFASWRLQDSRIGRAWIAMREDEQVAEAIGINTVTAKLLAFVTGAVLASLAGALFSAKIGSIFPNSFALIVSIIVLVLIIVGGMGNIPGVAVGAIMLLGILGGPSSPGLLREFEGFKLLIYGTLLIYMMLKRPEGLLPSIRRTRELHQEEFLQDAWLRKEVDAEEAEAAAESGI